MSTDFHPPKTLLQVLLVGRNSCSGMADVGVPLSHGDRPTSFHAVVIEPNPPEGFRIACDQVVSVLERRKLHYSQVRLGPCAHAFDFRLQLPSPSAQHRESQCQVTVMREVVVLSLPFCLGEREIPLSHLDLLCALANYLNSLLNLSVVLTDGRSVRLALRLCHLDFDSALYALVVGELLVALQKQAETVFLSVERLLKVPASDVDSVTPEDLVKGKDRRAKPQRTVIFREENLSPSVVVAEEREREEILKNQTLRQFFYFEGLETTSSSVTIAVPSGFYPLTEFLARGMILTALLAQELVTIVGELQRLDFGYQNISSLIYLTNGEHSLSFQLLPKHLAQNRVRRYQYSDFLTFLCVRSLRALSFLSEETTAEAVYSSLSLEDGQRLDSSAVRCSTVHCSHTAPRWWARNHSLGRTAVTLFPVFRSGRRQDVHSFLTQFALSVKFAHSKFQCAPLGVTLMEDVEGKTLFFVTEAPTYNSIREFLRDSGTDKKGVAKTLSAGIESAVRYHHSRGDAQLFLSPSTIGVSVYQRPEGQQVQVRLPSIAHLSAHTLADAIAFSERAAIAAGDWHSADCHSLRLLQRFLLLDEDRSPQHLQLADFGYLWKGDARAVEALLQ